MTSLRQLSTVGVGYLLLMFAAGPAHGQETLAIKGGRVLTLAGPPIENGVVLLRAGKIVAVGADVAIPVDAKVIDAAGKVVMPGHIETHSNRGMDQTNENNPNVPFLSVVDSIDPAQDYFDECRRNGVTTVAIVPGNNTMIGGQAAIVKTAGTYITDMLVKRAAGIKISLRPTNERSRMSQLVALRKELDDAKADLEKERKATTAADKPAPTGKDTKKEDQPEAEPGQVPPRRPPVAPGGGGEGPPPPSPEEAAQRRAALVRLLKGEFPAFIYCELAMDVHQALRLMKDYQLRAILVLGADCHKAATALAALGQPVVLDANLVFWETDPVTGDDRRIALPAVFRAAGVPFTYQVTGFASGNLFRAPNLPATLGSNYLWYQAATAVKYGVPRDEALAALASRPAKMLGLDHLVGTLEPGKDADVIVLSGDPLKLDTWVDHTIIRGQIVYQRDQDRKLKDLLQPAPGK